MKRAEWIKGFWAKAGAFLLAVLCVPFGGLCGASLLAAYEFAWWTGEFNEEYRSFYQWAQGKYWTLRGVGLLYGLRTVAIPLLAAAALLFLFFLVYLAWASGRRPGTDETRAGWQERIPFDLYLLAMAAAAVAAAFAADELLNALRDEPFLCALLLLGLATAAAALLLAAWMTLCARVKLGGWWKNTVVYRVLRLCWRALRWCGRVLRGVWHGTAAFLRGIPLVWKTAAVLGAMSLLEFIAFLNSGMNEANFWFWLLVRAALVTVLLWAAVQLRTLQAGGAALAAGDLDAKVDTRGMYWDFRRHGENLNDISRGMQLAVEKQLKSERLKTELITNVSHDIKTPLTSIISYVDLLRRDPGGEQAEEYLEVLDRQSKRLKKLTEDLVEMSKASTGNIPVNASRRSVNELLTQALGEYEERLERAGLDAVPTLPERECFIRADGTLLWRVLDNVFSNACKYALPGTRFYIDARESGDSVCLSFKNISRDRLNIPASELMERFVRGDSARGGEGSGLGLNIAKSLTELQGGGFAVSVDGDLFKVDITFPLAQ